MPGEATVYRANRAVGAHRHTRARNRTGRVHAIAAPRRRRRCCAAPRPGVLVACENACGAGVVSRDAALRPPTARPLHFFSFILCFHSLRHICIHYGRVSDDSRRGHDSFTNTYLPRASPSGEAAHDAMSALRTGHIPFARLHHHRAHGVGKLTLSHALQ